MRSGATYEWRAVVEAIDGDAGREETEWRSFELNAQPDRLDLNEFARNANACSPSVAALAKARKGVRV